MKIFLYFILFTSSAQAITFIRTQWNSEKQIITCKKFVDGSSEVMSTLAGSPDAAACDEAKKTQYLVSVSCEEGICEPGGCKHLNFWGVSELHKTWADVSTYDSSSTAQSHVNEATVGCSKDAGKTTLIWKSLDGAPAKCYQVDVQTKGANLTLPVAADASECAKFITRFSGSASVSRTQKNKNFSDSQIRVTNEATKVPLPVPSFLEPAESSRSESAQKGL